MLRLGAECVQDADDGGIRGENAQAHGCDDSGEEEDRHNQRDHVQSTLENQSLCNASPTFTYGLSAKAKRQNNQSRDFSNLPCVDAPRC
jgi:hypothetical protein